MLTAVEHIVASWPKVASVTHWQPSFAEEPELDYPLSTFPVDAASLRALPEGEASALATSLWIQYNRRTIDAEEYVANPAIDWLVREATLPQAMQLALMQAAVDERYHTYFHALALQEAQSRSFVQVPLARSVTVRELLARLAACAEPWQRDLVQLAYATVAEVSVNAFLDILSKSPEIKASNRTLVAMHNADEVLHSRIFVEVVGWMLAQMPRHEAAFLVDELKAASESFLKHDFSMYRAVLQAHDLALDLDTRSTTMSRDLSGIHALLQSLEQR